MRQRGRTESLAGASGSQIAIRKDDMIQALQPASSADGVCWDLGDLYHAVDDPKITHDLEEVLRRARAFEAAYRGKVNVEGGPPAETLLAALQELESLYEQMDRPAVYAGL